MIQQCIEIRLVWHVKWRLPEHLPDQKLLHLKRHMYAPAILYSFFSSSCWQFFHAISFATVTKPAYDCSRMRQEYRNVSKYPVYIQSLSRPQTARCHLLYITFPYCWSKHREINRSCSHTAFASVENRQSTESHGCLFPGVPICRYPGDWKSSTNRKLSGTARRVPDSFSRMAFSPLNWAFLLFSVRAFLLFTPYFRRLALPLRHSGLSYPSEQEIVAECRALTCSRPPAVFMWAFRHGKYCSPRTADSPFQVFEISSLISAFRAILLVIDLAGRRRLISVNLQALDRFWNADRCIISMVSSLCTRECSGRIGSMPFSEVDAVKLQHHRLPAPWAFTGSSHWHHRNDGRVQSYLQPSCWNAVQMTMQMAAHRQRISRAAEVAGNFRRLR